MGSSRGRAPRRPGGRVSRARPAGRGAFPGSWGWKPGPAALPAVLAAWATVLAAAAAILAASPAAARVPLQVSGHLSAWPATWWHTWLDGGHHVDRYGLSNGGGVSLEAYATPWLAVGVLADATAVAAPGVPPYRSPMPVVGTLASVRLVLPAAGRRVVEPYLRLAAGYALFLPEGAGREHGWAVRFRPGVQYTSPSGGALFLEAGYHHDGFRHDYRGQDDDPGGDLRVLLHALEVCLGVGWRF